MTLWGAAGVHRSSFVAIPTILDDMTGQTPTSSAQPCGDARDPLGACAVASVVSAAVGAARAVGDDERAGEHSPDRPRRCGR